MILAVYCGGVFFGYIKEDGKINHHQQLCSPPQNSGKNLIMEHKKALASYWLGTEQICWGLCILSWGTPIVLFTSL